MSVKIQDNKVRIIATIGPASSSEEVLTEMVKEGVDILRMNFSHGSFDEHQVKIDNGRKVAEKINTSILFMQDLGGPKIRIGTFGNNPENNVNLREDQEFILTTEKVEGTEDKVFINYSNLPKEVEIGNEILIDDGNIKLEVTQKTNDDIYTKVLIGGEIKGNRGVNIPEANLSTKALTEKDKKDLDFGVKNQVDYVALSFVRTPEDVEDLRNELRERGLDAKIISKIETPQALENIDKIIDLSDGIMVARGDLAVEIGIEEVPVVQKKLIKKCNEAGKFVIVATQMLEEMVESPNPTRAEVSDVANAILDGADAIMLSQETTVGKYPVKAVEMMAKVAKEIEEDLKEGDVFKNRNFSLEEDEN
jgi:pyruvate kinase